MNQTRVTLSTDVLATQLPDQETVLLHLQRGEYYTLNDSGSLIWQGLQQQQDLVAVSERLALHYHLSPVEASAHVIQLVEELAAAGLVHVV